MEIRDYLHGARRRLWIVVVIPLLAAGLAGYYVYKQAPKFTASASVVLTAPRTTGSLIGAVNQLVANFNGAIRSTQVVDPVARTSLESTKQILSGLSTKQIGTSFAIEVRYTSPNRKAVPVVVKASTQQALDVLATTISQPEVASVAAAQASYDKAQKDLAAFATKIGGPPDQVFVDQQSVIHGLKLLRLQAVNQGKPVKAASLQSAIDKKSKALSVERTELQQLLVLQHASERILESTQTSLTVAQGDADALRSSTVTLSATTQVRRLPVFIQSVAAAAVLGFALAVGLLMLLELISPTSGPRRRPSRRERRDAKRAAKRAGSRPAEIDQAVPRPEHMKRFEDQTSAVPATRD